MSRAAVKLVSSATATSPRKRAGKAVTTSETAAAEVTAFMQNLYGLNTSLGHQLSPLLEKALGLDIRLCTILYKVQEGLVYPGAIAQSVCLPASLISKHLDQLTHMGLVVRSIDEQDTRRIRISLTAKGKRVTRETDVVVAAVVDERLARIPTKRREIFLSTLADLARGPE